MLFRKDVFAPMPPPSAPEPEATRLSPRGTGEETQSTNAEI